MKPKKKMKKLRITEADFMLANRRAARLEEIAEHGRPVSYRTALHKSKKVYDRKRLKKAGIMSDDLPFLSAAEEDEDVEVVAEGGVVAEELAGVLAGGRDAAQQGDSCKHSDDKRTEIH